MKIMAINYSRGGGTGASSSCFPLTLLADVLHLVGVAAAALMFSVLGALRRDSRGAVDMMLVVLPAGRALPEWVVLRISSVPRALIDRTRTHLLVRLLLALLQLAGAAFYSLAR